ncbi:MAG: hypothetical protein O2951_12160 [Bacteroidetes bacterium]|nr:hypothetical protein [Bacteroidota bacterium]
MFRITYIFIALALLTANSCYGQQEDKAKSPLESLPPWIKSITHFGQRADFSPDGKQILFLEKTFGDVYEVEIETGALSPLTHHYLHEGYTRALYLSNGDILLSGSREYNAKDPWPSREITAELWVLKKDLTMPPIPLGEYCFEGPAVSRKDMKIAWTVHHGNYPDKIPEKVWEMWMGEINYDDDTLKLVSKRKILDNQEFSFFCELETQNFIPPDEKQLTFSIYVDFVAEVMSLDIETGKVVNHTNSPPGYDEPEGIFPDGKFTLVESDKHNLKGPAYIDIYKLTLDGSGKMERLTFFADYPGYQATNPVVSDDGQYMAFQLARKGDAAGIGHGLLLFDFDVFYKMKKN